LAAVQVAAYKKSRVTTAGTSYLSMNPASR
jgi:hypothetical protein